MAILSFQKPDKVVMLEADDFRGTFEFRPLEPGYGTTIGNALRRVLLSSLEGYAITSVQIDGVDHEFSSLPGVVEDMTDIILRLKQIRFRRQLEDYDHEKLTFTVKNQTVFKAGDLNSNLNGFQVLNPDLEICHMEARPSCASPCPSTRVAAMSRPTRTSVPPTPSVSSPSTPSIPPSRRSCTPSTTTASSSAPTMRS